jgi:hypothetical protein
MTVAAGAAALVALVVYAGTLLPGVSFGDWAEMQQVPARLEVAHPSGFPLYVLVGKLFSLIPIGSVAFRANLLSAVAAAAAVGVTVLIAGRLGVRPVVAFTGGIALAGTGTLWHEATVAEVNTLHLLLVALVVHRALVWREARRDRDLLLGALFAGLALSNHLLALTTVPIVVAAVLLVAARGLLARPWLVPLSAGLLLVGLSPYLFIPLRALAGPPEVYAPLTTWDGFVHLVTAEDYRSQMKLGWDEGVARAWEALPDIVTDLVAASNPMLVTVGAIGGVLLVLRRPWAGLVLAAIAAVNVYVYANYYGNLAHYLLVTWLVVAVAAAVAVEFALRAVSSRLPRLPRPAEVVLAGAAALSLAAGWAEHDLSEHRQGEQFAAAVLAALPPDTVLVSYWDALTTLGYAHCIDGVRPDVALVHFDETFRGTCDQVPRPWETIADRRPMYALLFQEHDLDRLRGSFDLVPEATFRVPYGYQTLDHTRPLYRLMLKASARP